MKCVLQYTNHAQVIVDNTCVGKINQGYVVFVGIEQTDTTVTAHKIARKIAKLRIIPDEKGKLNQDLSQIDGSILLISQFTLCADTSSNRPSFSNAAKKEQAVPLLQALKHELETAHHLPVQTGLFGAHMRVDFINEGPITILFNS